MPTLESVGTFFGITSKEKFDQTIEEWQSKVQTKIKQGDFGISLRRSVSALHRTDSSQLLTRARKVLSLVETAQKVDDPSDDEEEKNDVVNGANSQSCPSLEIIVNQLYCHEEDELESVSENVLTTSIPNLLESDTEPSVTCMAKISKASTDLDKQAALSNEKSADLYKNDEPSSRKTDDIDKQLDIEHNQDSTLAADADIEDIIKDGKQDHLKGSVEVVDEKDIDRENDSDEIEIEIEICSVTKQEKYEESTNSQEVESSDNEVESNYTSSSKEEIKLNLLQQTSSTSKGKDGENIEDNEDGNHDVTEKMSRPLGPEDFVYGKDAYIHYKFFTQVEKKQKKKNLEKKCKEKLAQYDWKIAAVDELVSMAKDYYWNPKSLKADKWKALKQRVKKNSSHKLGSLVNRKNLDSIRQHKPFFTIFITIVQLITLAVMCGFGNLTYIGVEPILTLESDVQTFYGMEIIHKWTPPNIWIGPDQQYIISLGGLFAPCMREDIEIQLLYTNQDFSKYHILGCCEILSRNRAATTMEQECTEMTEGVGVWRAGVPCGKRPPESSNIRHVLKPCCMGNKGQCQLLSYKHCIFLGGYFYRTGPEHCSQVNCLSNYCTPGSLSANEEQPWHPASPQQWWRVPLSLLYHQGIIHVVLVAGAQLLLMVQMERTAGWLRMIIIYTLSGSGSLLVASIVDPYHCHVGAVGALFGMVGVTLIELIQFWTIVQKPVLELIKLLAVVCFFLLLGTLPYLNIFGMFSGLIIGAVTGIIVLPYVTFGKWRARIRIVLVCIAVPALLLTFFTIFHVFLSVQSTGNCEFCNMINCISYSEKMCNSSLWLS